jgi:hypothetical protein
VFCPSRFAFDAAEGLPTLTAFLSGGLAKACVVRETSATGAIGADVRVRFDLVARADFYLTHFTFSPLRFCTYSHSVL